MPTAEQLFHNLLGDTHQGRLIDKLGNFATENFGEQGLKFFNTLTVAQVLYQLYEARHQKKDAARALLGKITTDKIKEFCKKEKNPEKQKEFAAQQIAIYQLALSRF